MPQLLLNRRIEAPTSVVFDRCTDFPNAAGIVPAITRVEVLTPGPVGKGYRFKETRVMFGREATETMEVVEWEPGRVFALGGTSCGMRFKTRFECVAEGGATMLKVCFDATAESLMAKIMSPLSFLMLKPMRKCMEGDLDAIARAATGSKG
ncbi:MAG: SRPBCC family protein [Phycisphaerales bacterium]